MDEKNEKLLRQYLDGELSDAQEQQALHMIADDPEMRSMLHFERQLQTSFSDEDTFEVPAGFSDGVMNAIGLNQNEEQTVSPLETLRRILRSLWIPKQIRFRPAYALCLLLVFLAISALPFYASWQSPDQFSATAGASVERVSDNGEQVWTRFVYIDNKAQSIAIAGDFNNWEPTQLTRKNVNGEQVWTGLIPMKRGEHRYMFVKNGKQWVTDPLATVQQDDGFGNKNAVIFL